MPCREDAVDEIGLVFEDGVNENAAFKLVVFAPRMETTRFSRHMQDLQSCPQ